MDTSEGPEGRVLPLLSSLMVHQQRTHTLAMRAMDAMLLSSWSGSHAGTHAPVPAPQFCLHVLSDFCFAHFFFYLIAGFLLLYFHLGFACRCSFLLWFFALHGTFFGLWFSSCFFSIPVLIV